MGDWSKERLVKGLKYIDMIASHVESDTDLKPKATELYREAVKTGIETNWFGIKHLAAGSVHVASRMESAPVNAEVIAEAFPPEDEHITKESILKISKELRNVLDLGAVLADPADVAAQAVDELGASDEFRERTMMLVNAVKTEQATVGLKASTIAGGAIYVVSLMAGPGGQGRYTQSEITEAVGVSEVSIRNSYKQIARAGREADALAEEVPV